MALEVLEDRDRSSSNGYLDPEQVKREALLRSAYGKTRQAYLDWCKKYDKKEDPIRFSTFSSNYMAMKEWAKKAGREVTLNQYADYTKKEYAELVAETAEKPTQRAEEAREAAQRAAARTAAVSSAAQDQYGRSSDQGAKTQDAYARTISPTRPEQNAAASAQQDQFGRPSNQEIEVQDPYGRTVRSTRPVRPTQPVRKSEPPARPTQVIQRFEQNPDQTTTGGTQVIQIADQPQTDLVDDDKQRRTLLIDENIGGGENRNQPPPKNMGPIRPTIVMNKKEPENKKSKFSFWGSGEKAESADTSEDIAARARDAVRPTDDILVRPALVAKKKDPDSEPRDDVRGIGTIVIQKNGGGRGDAPSRGTVAIQRNQRGEGTSRGTVVIQRKQNEPQKSSFGFDFFSANKKSEDDLRSERGAVVIKKSGASMEKPAAIFSLFGGTKKTEEDSRAVRGTIVLQKKDESAGFSFFGASKQTDQTLAIKKNEAGTEKPSTIFSLFGGTKKTEEDSRAVRGTIVLQKKDESAGFPFFGASKQTNRPARKTLVLKKKEDKSSVFSFFGGAKKAQTRTGAPSQKTIFIKEREENFWDAALSFFNEGQNTLTGVKEEQSLEAREAVSTREKVCSSHLSR
jgi:hypothetical protein